MPIPESLLDRLRAGLVVPFVGAGVSMNVLDRVSNEPVFPSWQQLLLKAADHLEREAKPDDAGLIRYLLKVRPPDVLQAADRARAALGPIWYEFLRKEIDIEFDRINPASLELARSIWRLGSKLVITTNYDSLLKWACPWPENLQSLNTQSPAEQASFLQRALQRPVIWHLHGRISNASELILSPDGYELLYSENDVGGKEKYEAALETLRHLIASKSLLFVGFSLDDEYFGLQLKSVQEIYKGSIGPHYAIVKEEHVDRVRSLKIEPVTFSSFGEPQLALMAELAAAVELEPSVSSSSSNTFGSEQKPLVIPDYGPHRPVFYVPFKQKGNQIVGQQQVIEDVRKQLTEGKRTAIGQTASFRGLGGLGKTQLAVEYAYRYRDEYPNGVIWINADQDIDAQLIEIAEKARWIAPVSDHKYKIQIAQQRIRSYSDCLIVFDNLEDIKHIEPYLPELDAHPHILVTSRKDYPEFHPVPLDVLDQTLSLELLLKEADRSPENNDEEEAALGIVGLLGGLPLALELAGAYLGHRRTGVTFKKYYELLSKDLKSALPKNVRTFTRHEGDLYNTLRLSENLLQEEDHLRDILDLLTWSGSAPMSTELVASLLDLTQDAALVGALALGAELRLLQPSKGSEGHSIHRLVGEVRRAEFFLDERLEWVNGISRRLGQWFQENREDFAQLTRFESEIDHLKKWQENAAIYAPAHASKLMWLQAYPAYHRGRFVEAREYVIQAQRIFNEVNDTNFELKANLLHDLATTNLTLGDFQSVLALHMEALKIRQSLFGQAHPDVANSLGSIGTWYGRRGDLRRALQYSEQALIMRRNLFGERHPKVANSLNHFGRWSGESGDSLRALEYLEQALSIQRETFGESHPHIANSLSEIGRAHHRQGNRQLALQYIKEALSMERELFGDFHPEIAVSLNNVGRAYLDLGDFGAAFEHLNQALGMYRRLFGERHPSIATTLVNIGDLHGQRGDLQTALEYTKKALAMYCDFLGEEHQSTIKTAAQVAFDLVTLGRRQEAYDLVARFLPKAPKQGPIKDQLKVLETALLSKPVRPGFRQPPKTGKRKGKKKRR